MQSLPHALQLAQDFPPCTTTYISPTSPTYTPRTTTARRTSAASWIVWPLCFQGSAHTCAMPLASESRVRVAGSSSKDMRSEDASFASAVTVAYSEGLDELIVFFDRVLA